MSSKVTVCATQPQLQVVAHMAYGLRDLPETRQGEKRDWAHP
jgi:hypothetical protein